MEGRIPGHGNIEIYVTKQNQVAIKQDNSVPHEDDIVIFNPNDVDFLCHLLRHFAAEANEARKEELGLLDFSSLWPDLKQETAPAAAKRELPYIPGLDP